MKITLRLVVSLLSCIFCAWAHAAGSLKVTLNPATAVSAGAQWRVDGGVWQASDATVKGLTAGAHNVEFKSVSGWMAPVSTSVTVKNGNTATLFTASYTPTASLLINLTPASAQWRVDGGAWRASGATAADLAAGAHTVEYAALTGYTTPASETVSLTAGQSLALSRTYTQMAEIWLTLVPSSGQWRVNGGAWQPSGGRQFMSPGNVLVEYAPVELYDPPVNDALTLAPGGIFYGTKHYTSTKPKLRIDLTPTSGQWRIDSGAWNASGAQLTELAVGMHTIDYVDIGGDYLPLASETVTLSLRQNAALSRTYLPKPASVAITLAPTTAQWRLNGGTWQSSGATLTGLAAGSYTIDYSAVAGYTAPPSETLALSAGQAATFTRSYTSQLAQITVLTSPSSGLWRIYPDQATPGGAWNPGGATVTGLSSGTYQIAFSPLAGYATPGPLSVTLAAGDNLTTNANYVAIPTEINVALQPAAGQWRLDGGAWQPAGATLGGLGAGSHLIEFAALPGYTTPLAQTISLNVGDSRRYSFLYAPTTPGVLKFNLTPAHALWRIDGGAWNASGATIGNVADGNHTLEFSDVTGYLTPGTTTLPASATMPARLSWSYDPGIANLKMALTPSNARWRVNGSAWGTITAGVSGNANRPFWVEYEPVAGYTTPPAEYIKLPINPNYVTLTRTYQPTSTASVSIALTPEHGQWRVHPAGAPSGSWQTGNATVAGLAPGTYTIEYGAILNHGSPSTETLTLAASQAVVLSRAYTEFPGQVVVTSSTPGAQWRISPAGGPTSDLWLPAGTPASNLPPGDYTIDYTPVSGYERPFDEPLTLYSAEIVTVTKNYHRIYDLEILFNSYDALWRVDGGAWIGYGEGALNLSPGQHLVEYAPLSGYAAPPAETITFDGSPLKLFRDYKKLGEVTVALWPNNAQWRVDGGPWQPGSAIVGGLSLNTPHTIEYSNVPGWTAPALETVNFSYSGQQVSLSRSYQQ